LRQVRNCFRIRRALEGALARPLPVADGGLVLARRGAVVRQQLGLCLSRLWKLSFEYLGDVLVVLLSSAFQQGRIRGILNKRTLKVIRCLWWSPSLVDNLSLDQPAQCML